MNIDEMDLLETNDLIDALARRFDTFAFMGTRDLKNGRMIRDLHWGGDLSRAVNLLRSSEDYLQGRRDGENGR